MANYDQNRHDRSNGVPAGVGAMRFCSACGHALPRPSLAGRTRSSKCRGCGVVAYRNPTLTAVGILTSDSYANVWLVRRGLPPLRNRWALPGGYVEVGEHPEETVARECLEEVGLEVRVNRIVGIYTATWEHEGAVVIAYDAKVTVRHPQPVIGGATDPGVRTFSDPSFGLRNTLICGSGLDRDNVQIRSSFSRG